MSEPRTPFLSSKLHRSVAKSFVEEIAEFMRKDQAEYLDPNNTIKFQHGQRWESPANNLGDKSGEMEQHSVESSLSLADVVKGNPMVIFEHTKEVASGMTSSFERMLFSKLNQATTKSGNVVDASKHKSLLGAFTESLENIEMSVDDDGNLSLPTFFIHPSQKEKLVKEIEEVPPELLDRLEVIKAKKLEQATQKESERICRFERREE